MRAALLPAGGDPFLNAFWLKHYERWADQVDELHVLICGQRMPESIEYIRDKVAGTNIVLHESPARIDHGVALRLLVDWTSADHVLLCEDDAFVREPEAIGRAFSRIELGEVDIVGSPRNSASGEVVEAADARFGTTPATSTCESGHAFWPAFLFVRKRDLLDTDQWYGAQRWMPGDTIPGLDHVVRNEAAADTLAATSYQLRARGLSIDWQPQYRADIDQMGGWGDPPWFHVGSLSTGYGYLFVQESTGLFSEGSFERIAAHVRENGRHDWAKRIAFWRRTLNNGDGLEAQRSQYREEMARFVALAELDTAEIDRWDRAFGQWVTW